MDFPVRSLPAKDDEEFCNLVKREFSFKAITSICISTVTKAHLAGPRRVSKLPHPLKRSKTTSSSALEPQHRQRRETTERRVPYVSFGDQGITASAGTYGSLLRICRPMNSGSRDFPDSGMIGLEFADTEPWFISGRANEFLENAQDVTNGFGLRVQNDLSSEPPTVEFLNHRWPIISYSTKEGFLVTVRLWCQQDVVVQHFQVENPKLTTGEQNPELKLQLDVNFSMQDLNYLKRKENLRTRHYKGVHGHGIVVVQSLPENTSDGERPRDNREHIGVLIGLFREGVAQKLQWDVIGKEESKHPRVRPISITHPLGRDESVEFTAVFNLRTIAFGADWRQIMISSENTIFDPQTATLTDSALLSTPDPKMSWHLCRNLEHIMSVCSVPLDTVASDGTGSTSDDNLKNDGPTIALISPDGQFNILSRRTPKSRSIRPIALTCGDFGDHRVSVSGSL